MNKIKSFYKAFEDRFRGPRELILERLKVYLPLIEPLKSLYPDNRAIDLGCGRGEWLQLIDSNGFKAHGVDIDEAMVENAKEFGLSVELRDALEYLKSLSDNSVSIVTAFHLAEHISFDTLQGLIIESLRVLKPAGLMILETPNPENVAVGSSTFYLDPTHLKPLPLAFLSYLPEYYGFARVNVFRLNGTVIDDSNISLLSIINGVSPDYSVIAQKKASPSMLKEFDGEFYKKLGVSLEELAIRYEQMRHVQQEQEVAAQLLVIQKREDQEKAKQFQQLQIEAHQIAAEQARVYTERERTLHQNIQNAQQALHDREKEWSDREKELISLISQSDNKRLQESADLMRALAEREQEFGERQLQAMQAAEQEKAETLRMHAEREGTWHYELDQHLQLLQKQCDDLLAQHQRLEQFRQAANAVEVNLKQQLQTERQTVMQIQQVIDSLNGELYDIRSSFSWLLTAPFRKLVGLFKTVEPLTAAATSTRVMFVHIPIEPSNQFFTSRHQLIRMDNVGKSTSTFRDNVTTASTLDELISFHDEQFVRCAYQAVLGRTPDSEGLDYYLHRLRTGVPKIQILAQLRLSEEGKAHAAQVSGLDPAIQRYQRGRYPLIGWMFRLLNDAESNHPIENKIRSIENQLYVLNAGLCQCVTQQIKSAAVGGEPFISGHASVAKTSALDEVINASRQNGENASPSDLHIDTVLQCIREEIKSVAVGGEPFISGHASVAKTSALDEVINASRQNGENASRGDLHISAVLQCIREEIKSVAVGGEPFISGHASV
ncbi:MAG: methyltransferase domain-containing protein, partial [Dissulfurispiraceae bacterium]